MNTVTQTQTVLAQDPANLTVEDIQDIVVEARTAAASAAAIPSKFSFLINASLSAWKLSSESPAALSKVIEFYCIPRTIYWIQV